MSSLEERIKQNFSYDSETGIITSLNTGYCWEFANTKKGYILISFEEKTYKAHRLAWLIFYGEFPSGNIDHKDRNKSNNRINNLRLCSDQENLRNRDKRKNNKTGYKNVSFLEKSGKYRARIVVDGKYKHLGYFSTAEEASIAIEEIAKDLHKEFYYKNFLS